MNDVACVTAVSKQLSSNTTQAALTSDLNVGLYEWDNLSLIVVPYQLEMLRSHMDISYLNHNHNHSEIFLAF